MNAAIILLGMTLAGQKKADVVRPSILGVEPLRTTCVAARHLLGAAGWARDARGGESVPFVACYEGGTGERHAFLLIESGAAGGYGAHTVDGFTLTEREPENLRPVTPARSREPVVCTEPGSNLCCRTKLVHRGIALSNGLRLGMARKQVVKIMGPPTSSDGSTLVYKRDDRTETTSWGGIVRSTRKPADFASVEVDLAGDHVIAIRVERSDMI